MKYGIQQLQLGSILKSSKEAEKALASLVRAGYEYIELNGFMIRKTPFIARTLLSLSGMGIHKSQKLDWKGLIASSGLKVISIHEDLDTAEQKVNEVLAEMKEFSAKYLVITGMYRFDYSSEEELGKLVVRLNRVGRVYAKEGVQLLYHNHDVEYQTVDGDKKVIDYLLDGLNPEWVNFEFDSYWTLEAGADPLLYMDRLGKRMKLYHICDRGNLGKGPYMTPIIKQNAVELGRGNANLPGFILKAKENWVEAIFLEQHRNYVNNDPIESAVISGEYLRNQLGN